MSWAVSSDDANKALKSAETDFVTAFTAVATAEEAGANVTNLVTKLNAADGVLSEGYDAFMAGDYDTANSKAASCSAAVEGVVDEAGLMKTSAERAIGSRTLLTAVFSGVGLIILFVLGFLGWGFLKNWYTKRLLDLKPVLEESQ